MRNCPDVKVHLEKACSPASLQILRLGVENLCTQRHGKRETIARVHRASDGGDCVQNSWKKAF